jgi:hypothetical protein
LDVDPERDPDVALEDAPEEVSPTVAEQPTVVANRLATESAKAAVLIFISESP